MKTLTHMRLISVIMVLILGGGLGLSHGIANAQERHDSTDHSVEVPAPLPRDKVTIEKKELETVTTRFGDVYALFVETIIVGADGNQINIRELPVPCDAEIIYTSKGGGARKALRIGVVAVHPNATTQWTAKNPG